MEKTMRKRIILEQNPILDPDGNPIVQTQNKHIAQFNRLGKIMASCADYYAVAKSGDFLFIANVQIDLDESYIIAGDRIFYNGNSLDAAIISPYGSKVIQPSERKVLVPDYSDWPTLNNVLATEQGVLYFQVLFGTTDSADEIENTLGVLSGKNNGNTRIWTPDQHTRTNGIRVVSLGYDGDDFYINGINSLDWKGRARGVRYVSAERGAKK